MIFLDTSSLIRFFTNDDKEKALLVKELLEKEKEIFIPEVVFPEIDYVLTKVYKATREKVLEAFKFLVSRSNIKLSQTIKRAIKIFEEFNLDMADCMIVAACLKGKLASFDKELLDLPGVKKYWRP